MTEYKLKYRDPGILIIDEDGRVYGKFLCPEQAERALVQLQAEGKIDRAVTKGRA